MDLHAGEVLAAPTITTLQQSLTRSVRSLGYRYFIYRGWFAQPGGAGRDVYIDDCPPGWRDYCSRQIHERRDPLQAQAFQGSKPMPWARLAALAPEFYARARDFGLVTGTSHPVHGPGAQWSSLTFVCDRLGHDPALTPSITLGGCQLLATYAHDAVARILVRERGGRPARTGALGAGFALNEREREILGLAAAGHTNAGIAGLLSISDRTVVFHLRNAREKLGAANCVHAVSKALSLGLIASA
ncbi:MAG TPA: LuxR family transcriptional regulator [Burkholderiales bacterium]